MSTVPARCYGRIAEVQDGSPAEAAGLRVGDDLVAIDSQPVHDILDFNYLAAEENPTVRIQRGGVEHTLKVRKQADEDMGIEFEKELFDGVRTCHNNCVFCFVRQMPKGMRPSLNIRDDDYRLSLVHGNYITLTNLADEDLDRMCSQRMSPIYVSVHATDPELRTRMMRSKNAGKVMDQLSRLAQARITMHAQIVLCPGLNDAENLERTVRDLASLHPWIASIAIVPVGLTRHREGLTPLVKVNAELARRVIESCEKWQREFRNKLGTRLIFPSDEFYLLSGKPFPSAMAYEGFPQLEDGIGVSRLFLDDLRKASRQVTRKTLRSGKYLLITGTLAAPLVEQLAHTLSQFERVLATAYPVVNEFLGDTVTVAGLLTGRDIASALANAASDETALIPDVMLNEGSFLDDMTIPELQDSVRCRVMVVPTSPTGVIKALTVRAKSARRAVSCAACAGT